jgi:polar amino acid transport system substrate-binding protein
MSMFTPALIKALAPHGPLRAAINLGNPVLAKREDSGALSGVTVTLAQELARRLDRALELVPFEGAGKVVASAREDLWDIAFLAGDPLRAQEIAFSAPYVLIEGVYVVGAASRYQSVEDVDSPGTRIAVGEGSAYGLHLARALKAGELVPFETASNPLECFVEHKLEVGAGIRQPATAFVAANPGLRLIDEPFMQIQQAMATKPDRPEALGALEAFLADVKASGFLREALIAAGQDVALQAP